MSTARKVIPRAPSRASTSIAASTNAARRASFRRTTATTPLLGPLRPEYCGWSARSPTAAPPLSTAIDIRHP
ncbi:hypothetical protein GCM10018771_42440 [Streptomyces cellulosae]|nr:hypothetical protein GCM10018771_42440 [Streptomyces cellulosae]